MLTKLDLSYNRVGNYGAMILAPAIMHCRMLSSFSLRDNRVEADGMTG